MSLPLATGALAFGMAFGALAAQNQLSALESFLMSTLVFAGASQMVAMDIWSYPVPIWSLAMVAAVVNARMILESASLYPWLSSLPPHQRGWRIYAMLYAINDSSWALALSYHKNGGRDVGVFFGSCLVFVTTWVLGTMMGYYLGSQIVNPKSFGLDLVLPAFFAAMLVPMCKVGPKLTAILVSLIVSVFISAYFEGHAYLLIGALSGSIAAAILYKPEGDQRVSST